MAWNKDEGALVRWLGFSSEDLVKINDIELTTLKIHLVLEDALKCLLASRLKTNEDVFFDSSIGFKTLVEIALAGVTNDHLRGALRSLNTARNQMSHCVESNEFNEKLEIFVREIGYMLGRKTVWPADLNERLRLLREAFDDAAYEIFDIAINGLHVECQRQPGA